MKTFLAILSLFTASMVVEDAQAQRYPRNPRNPRNSVDEIIRCESRGGRFERCRSRVEIDDARLVRNLSNRRCIEGRDWGHERNFIWVNNGCRADFAISDFRRFNFNNVLDVGCSSWGRRYNTCFVGFGIRDVRLIREYSRTDCREGRNWGHFGPYIWVSNGCRAEFRVFMGRR